MKTLSIILSMMFLLAVVPSQAAQDNWEYVMDVGNPMVVTYDSLTAGVSPTSVDGFDSADLPGIIPNYVNMKILRTSADGWTGSDGFYRYDIRAPFATSKTWGNIYLWWQAGTRLDDQPLGFHPAYNTPAPPPNYVLTLYLDYVPAGVTYTGPWSWQLPNTGTLTIPTGTFTPFASETGLDGYKFHLTVTNVPEPSSLAALFCGLAGVGGVLYRRR